MSRRQPPERIQFAALDPTPAIDALGDLSAAGAGWMNLFPEVPEDEAAVVAPTPVMAIFGAAGPPIPQVTIVVPRTGRGGQTVASQIGITHGAGARVLGALAAEGIVVPEGWRVVQDHVRRGVVLAVGSPFEADEVLSWTIEAATALCPVPTSGRWLAELHRG